GREVFLFNFCILFFMIWICDRFYFFFSSRRRHTRFDCDWSSDVCSSDLRCNTPTDIGCWRSETKKGARFAPSINFDRNYSLFFSFGEAFAFLDLFLRSSLVPSYSVIFVQLSETFLFRFF